MNPDNVVLRAAVWIVPLVIAIVFHEVAHGWVARALGDPTAHERRRLSLNPLRHVDPIGTIVLPLGLALAHLPPFGWAKPVPVDARRLRNPRTGMMLVAIAGPATNIALALIGAVVLGLTFRGAGGEAATGVGQLWLTGLTMFLLINVSLALFNLLPVPPFDGGHIVQGLLPRPLAAKWGAFGRYAILFAILLIVVLPAVFPSANVVARVVAPAVDHVAGWFFALADRLV
jgi:Zn-dependent protease